jgi:hypothetical protein
LFFFCLLLGFVLFQGAGWVLMWQWQQQKAVFLAQKAILKKEKPLESVTLTRDFFDKIRIKPHEIRLDGRMYDFEKIEYRGDSVRLELYHDTHEEALYHVLAGVFSNDDTSGTHRFPYWLTHWTLAPFLVPEALFWSIQVHLAPPDVIFMIMALVQQAAPGCCSPPPEA